MPCLNLSPELVSSPSCDPPGGAASHRRHPLPLLQPNQHQAASNQRRQGRRHLVSDARAILAFVTLVPGAPMQPPPPTAPDIDDEVAGDELRDAWVSHYLPHWTTPEQSAARLRFVYPGLHLQIDEDQPDWRLDDAPLRVFNLQTAAYSGPVGSDCATHRHRADHLVVRTPVPTRLGSALCAGRVEVTLRASADPDCMTAIRLVGAEHQDPRECGEICVAEIGADAVSLQMRTRSAMLRRATAWSRLPLNGIPTG